MSMGMSFFEWVDWIALVCLGLCLLNWYSNMQLAEFYQDDAYVGKGLQFLGMAIVYGVVAWTV